MLLALLYWSVVESSVVRDFIAAYQVFIDPNIFVVRWSIAEPKVGRHPQIIPRPNCIVAHKKVNLKLTMFTWRKLLTSYHWEFGRERRMARTNTWGMRAGREETYSFVKHQGGSKSQSIEGYYKHRRYAYVALG